MAFFEDSFFGDFRFRVVEIASGLDGDFFGVVVTSKDFAEAANADHFGEFQFLEKIVKLNKSDESVVSNSSQKMDGTESVLLHNNYNYYISIHFLAAIENNGFLLICISYREPPKL